MKRKENKGLLIEYADSHPICEICGSVNVQSGPHHIVFRSDGGPDEEWNLVMLCGGMSANKCHDSKAHGVCAPLVRKALLTQKISDGYNVPAHIQIQEFGAILCASPYYGLNTVEIDDLRLVTTKTRDKVSCWIMREAEVETFMRSKTFEEQALSNSRKIV